MINLFNIKCFLLTILICVPSLFKNNVRAQNLIIKGIVNDASTTAPISGVTIHVDKTNLKTKTDVNGFFSINVNVLSKKTLIISSVGYKTHKISLFNYEKGTILKINLTSLSIKLNEVFISDNSAATIVAKAYSSIPSNYPNTDSFYEGFYRESSFIIASDGKEKIDYIIESVVDMKKGTYERTRSEDEIKLRNTKKIMTSDSGSRGRWYGGILSPNRSDLVKMRAKFLNPKYQNRYNYKKIKDTLLYNEPTYVIQFEPKDNEYYRGIVYVCAKNYAFIEINYSLTKAGLKHHYFFIGVKPIVKKGILSIIYFPLGGKWFLNNISHRTDIQVPGKAYYKYTTEYITTAVDTLEGNLFSTNINNKMVFWDRLSDKKNNTDTAFWKNYKLIPISNSTVILIDTVIKPLVKNKNAAETLKRNLVTSNLHKIITDGLMQYQYERGIGKTAILLTSAGLISPNWKNVYPFVEVGYRNYYNLQKRFNQEKTTWNNSANYFGIKLSLSTEHKLFSFGSSDDRVSPYISFSPIWGIQRQYSKHFAYNYYLGPKITNLTFSDSVPKKFGDFANIDGSLSYSF